MPIDSKAAFVDIISDRKVLELDSFEAFLDQASDAQRERDPSIQQGALSNVRGSWYEWLIGLGTLEYIALYPTTNILLPLPNVNGLNCEALYIDNIRDLIVSLRQKVRASSEVSLVTSNPDFVILRTLSGFFPPIRNYPPSLRDLDILDEAYSFFLGRCEFDDVRGYVSAKTSVRPDRRLQMSHEGSLMKALYRHIQTRQWNINAPGLKYFGVSIRFTEADRRGLRTVATHSLVSVNSVPEAAVDDLFQVNSGSDLKTFLDAIQF